MHTTNYFDTFIAVAEDSPVAHAVEPPSESTATNRTAGESTASTHSTPLSIAAMHYSLIAEHPYVMTSDEIVFETHARRAGIADADRDAAREEFFAKGQPCLRSSPLGKRYGWGLHHDEHGRVAAYAVDSDDYTRLAADPRLAQTRAMRSRRA